MVGELRLQLIELERQNEELRTALVAMEAERARSLDIYDLAPVGYCTLSGQELILEANRTAAKLLGMPLSALLMQPIARFILKEDQGIYYAYQQQLLATGQAQECELRLVRPDGTHLWVNWAEIAAKTDGDARVVRITFSDISERKRVEMDLRESEHRFHDLLMNIPSVAVQGYKEDGTASYWNEASEQLYGYRADEAIGHSLLDLIIPPEMHDGVREAMRGMFNTTTPIPAGELSLLRKDGSRVDVFSSHAYVRVPGQSPEMFCMDIDITERKLSEQSLQQSLKDKQALLMEVNHRVKNNLQVISSLLRLEGHRSQQKETKAVLAEMQGRIQSMALLHKLLYRSGTFASVDLGSYVQQVASQAYSAQSLPSSSVRLSLHVGSVQVGMDQAIAAGLLVNELISNCLKHAFPQDRSGEVLVVLQPVNADASQADPMWCLEVSDTGVGLPADVDQQRKTSLGLQLANDLGEQIGGSLKTESRPGQGTRFTLIFAALVPQSLVMPL
jgi:PAS domain S-box-containing protein